MTQKVVNVGKTKKWVPGARIDPYLAINFVVEIEGSVVAGFTDVTGLSIETQVERKTFGGENHREYTFFTQSKYTDITLKCGVTSDEYLWDWYKEVINGQIYRKNGSIYLLDSLGNAKVWWDFTGACPIKWEGPTFSSTSNSVAAETLVLTHNGIIMHKG
jgi:phage tail-like protein